MFGFRHNSGRRGMTLVELIVVVTIITLLLAITVPAMRPLSEGRRVREAARAVNMYIGSAQIHAVETQRPCGILLERFDTSADACVVLRQVAVPPPYAGDFDDSRIVIDTQNLVTQNPVTGTARVQFSNGENPFTPAFGKSLVGSGDSLQLNYQGHRWEIDSVSGTGPWTVAFTSQTASALPDAPAPGLPFQFVRQPVPTSAAPLRLPRGAVVDLTDSGTDADDTLFDPANPQDDLGAMIMFSPQGGVTRAYYSILNGAPPEPTRTFGQTVAPIYLMIGKWERTGSVTAEDGLDNWQDASNLWLAINAQSGLVTVAEMNAPNYNATTRVYTPPDITVSRSYARQAQISKGGR